MNSVALKSLIYEWRRFAPAMVAVAFSGLLVLLQAGIILGIFSLSSQYVTRSGADLWIGYPGVQSLDLGRPLSGPAEVFGWMNPHVQRLEPFLWGSGEWRTHSKGMVNVYIVGIDPRPDGMALSDALDDTQRALLTEPDAVLVDASDLHKLQVQVGQTAEINGRFVRVAGVTDGLRALGGVNVITSLATTRRLDPSSGPDGRVAYLLAKVDNPDASKQIAAALNKSGAGRGFEALTGDAFARRTTLYWLVESGAGVAFIFGSVVAILVAGVITSQTLSAAVAGSIREYAALRALGFSMRALRRIVVAQSAWVGAAGLIVAGVLTLLLTVAADAGAVPVVLTFPMIAASAALVMLTALGSGALALRRVAQADPAVLLL
ncbi:ABC transporter permease [Phenylobacterium sp.]|uniref:ABC transporter permease n=1 Tax=Phenylobacterium sp. TaxID=1871053 RepID=UPI0025D99497|nr:ABC transporter permease [Phenylobacterium sp.]